MSRQNYLFTSESVSEGHPDKVCDRISDEIVDLVYKEAIKTGVDPWSVRIAAETLTTTNRVVIAGEVRVPLVEGERHASFAAGPDAEHGFKSDEEYGAFALDEYGGMIAAKIRPQVEDEGKKTK